MAIDYFFTDKETILKATTSAKDQSRVELPVFVLVRFHCICMYVCMIPVYACSFILVC